MEETKKENWQSKFLIFLDKNFNIFLILILIFAFLIRLKYLTVNQAVWYDEAEYLSVAKNWAFRAPPFELHFVRPPLLPFIMAGLYKLGATEFTFRVLILLFSIIGVLFTYLVGKEIFDKKIALIATFIMSFFYLHLFYTARILTDIPSTTLWLISLWLFWRGYVKKESKYYLWLFGFFLVLGILIRFPVGLLAIIIVLYLIITEGFKFFKNKELWKTLIIILLSFTPYSIWYYLTYNRIPILGSAGFYTPQIMFSQYFSFLPTILQSPLYLFLIFFVIGFLLTLFNLILGLDMFKTNPEIKKQIFILIWLVIPLLYFAILSGMAEDRYLFYTFPAMFYLISFVLLKIYNFAKKYNQMLALGLVLLILIPACYTQLKYADNLIKLKSQSYIQFKYAGEFIKQNSSPKDKVIAAGIPQLTYYSDREIIYWTGKEEFENLIKSDKNIKFIVLSILEGSPQWSYSWPEENKDKVIPVFVAYLDPEKTKPAVVIYKIMNR